MEWLLDTSVFYRAASHHSRERLRTHANGARLTTSCSTLLEILSGMTPETFEFRKRALRAVIRLCGREGILTPDTDVVVGSAFGQTIEPFDIEVFWNGVRTVVDTPDFASASRGLPQPVGGGVFRIDFPTLAAWDADVGLGFKAEMDGKYRGVDPDLRAGALAAGVQTRSIAPFVREVQGDIARTETTRQFALVGLAGRAGLLSEDAVRSAVSDVHELERPCAIAKASYNGSLDGYLRIYAEYHAECARLQRDKVNRNDGLDFDPFVYLRLHDANQCYVSAETLWLTIAERVIPGRTINAVEVTARREVECQDESP